MKKLIAPALIVLMLCSGCIPAATPPDPAPGEASTPTATPPPSTPGETGTPGSFTNIAYAEITGADPELTSLDIYTPGRDDACPVMVFIHGGGWKAGDKSAVYEKPSAFNEAGYVYVTVNYRLSPEVMHPTHVSDVAAAIAWVYENITEYGGDPGQIFIMGHSAGAHLAALVTTDEQRLKEYDYSPEIVRGVVLLDGAGYDMARLCELNPALWSQFYELPFGEDPAVWADASPINHVAPGKGIPPFLIVYVAERPTSRLMSGWLSDALRDAGVSAALVAAEDKTHATLNREMGEPGDEVTALVFEFLEGLS